MTGPLPGGSSAPASAARAGPVVVGFDGTASAASAVRWAAREARRRRTVLHVVVAHDGHDSHLPAVSPSVLVTERPTAGPPAAGPPAAGVPAAGVPEQAVHAARDLAEKGARCARDVVPDLEVEALVEYAPPAAALVGCSLGAQKVVVGASERSRFAEEIAGSVVFAVAAHAHCPVTVVHGDVEALRDVDLPVLVGFDGSPGGEAALEHAAATAASLGRDLRVLVAWWTRTAERLGGFLSAEHPQDTAVASAERVLDAALVRVRERHPGLEVVGETVQNRPVRALVRASARAERLVVGSRGRGGFGALVLGSVSHVVIRTAYCPVTVVR